MTIDPGSKDRALFPVTSFDEKNPYFQFQDLDYGQIEVRGGQRLRPHPDPSFSLLAFSQFRNYVCIENVHQDRSACSWRFPIKRGGSNSISAASGIASRSAMLL